MSSDPRTVPREITSFPNSELGIVWEDGHESYYRGHTLRCACGCAACVDELTGRKILKDEAVPGDVNAVRIEPVGRYGVNIAWSDGHDSGIYPFRKLRASCPCGDCGG